MLARMADAIAHRGPDDAGEWLSPDGNVGLAHRRLAIIDLSSLGHQPMFDASGTVVIVFNGEIYNFQELRAELEAKGHAFVTTGDTEVLLAAWLEWGPKCVGKSVTPMPELPGPRNCGHCPLAPCPRTKASVARPTRGMTALRNRKCTELGRRKLPDASRGVAS